MNNLLKISIVSGISVIIYYCCKRPDKKTKVKFNDKPEIINDKIKPIIPITYNILDHYRILDSVYNIKLDLKQEPQIIDYYKLKSPIKKDDKWEIIS
jgi:hypothetical protein